MKERSSFRGRRAAFRASPTASISASSSFIRNWRWCRSCRSPRTSSSATNPPELGVIDWGVAFNRTRELLAKVGLKESPKALITNLGIGKQQLVEIAKALAKKVRLLILDEPTASLNETDSDALLEIARRVQGSGHHLDHHFAQAQRTGQGRRPDHRAARRRDGRDHRLPSREDQRRPHHQEHGRARDVRSLSAARAQDRRAPVRGGELAGRASSPCGARGDQGRQSSCQPRRSRRHRRIDGRRSHRARDEHFRSRLRTKHHEAAP